MSHIMDNNQATQANSQDDSNIIEEDNQIEEIFDEEYFAQNPIENKQVSKKMEQNDVLKNLKSGVDDLNTKFDTEDWDQIELRLSDFEREVLNCLATGEDSVPPEHPVIGEQLYLTVREKFKESPFWLVDEHLKKKKKKSAADQKDESSEEEPVDKKKKAKEPKLKKADLIRLENTLKTVNKYVDSILESFSESSMNCTYGLYTNKIIELRGITFAYMAWFILRSKFAQEYSTKKSKLTEVYEIMCSMERFINTCSSYSGKSLSNSTTKETVSSTLIADMKYWLTELKKVFPFDGITIYNIAPKLLIHSQYDNVIPNRKIKMRPNQRQLMNSISAHPEGHLIFYNAAIASGKTTLASVGIASYLEKQRKCGKVRADMQLIFCCNLTSVRRQVARNCWNAGIKFAIASSFYKDGVLHYKLTNHWGTKDNERIVIIASPDVTALLLEEDYNRIQEDAQRLDKERNFYSGKYWLFLDEPTVGADIESSSYLEANTKVFFYMPKWTVLSSATMPTPDKIKDIISHHCGRFPEVYVDTQITKEISIGCDVKTFENDMVVPHIGCKVKEQILTCINKINEVPFLGRLYTHRVAEKLWSDMTSNGITDITNIKEYFGNVDNLTSDNVRVVCIEMLKKLSEQSNDKIKRICSSNISAEFQEVKQSKKKVEEDDDGFEFEEEEPEDKVINHVDFNKLGTSEAAKYMNMNLVVSLDPLYTAKTSFQNLLEDVEKSGIDITRLRNFIAAYERKVEDYKKNREYLEKTLMKAKTKDDGEKKSGTRKEQHLSEEANKRGCGEEDVPILEFPKQFQINTLPHWRKYGSHYQVNSANIRPAMNITNLPVSDFTVEDWVSFLLFCGVGVYSPSQIKDPVYLREVLKLAEEGKLAYLVSDSSICYGTNYPINRVFICKDFAEVHSINTLFQLMGRAGRAGQSWKAEIYMDKSTAMKIIDFVQNVKDTSGDVEAVNMTNAFNKLKISAMKKEEDARLKEEEEERKLIEEALKIKRKVEEAARLKKIQKEKEALTKSVSVNTPRTTVEKVTNPTEKKVFKKEEPDNWSKLGDWRRTDKQQSTPTQEKEKYVAPYKRSQQNTGSDNWSKLGDTADKPKPVTEKTDKYVPPWKRQQASSS
jgi:hypothetical protein